MKRVEMKPFCFEHLDLFCWREDDLKTYGIRSEITDALAMAEEKGECWTAIYDGRIIAIGGAIAHTKKTGYGFTLFSEHADGMRLGAARAVRRMAESIFENMGLHRVVTYNRIGAEAHDKWCKWLGFKYDGVAEKYDDEGNNYSRYVLIR